MELNNSLSRVPGILYLWSQNHLVTELVKRKTFCIRMDTCSQDLGLILPLMVFCSRLQHISFLSVPHMVRILKNLFSLFRWFQLLYMGPVFTVQLFIFLIQLSALLFFQSGRFLQTSSPRAFQKISSLTSVHCWGWVHQGDPDYFQCSAWGGVLFPLGFPSFPHLVCFEHCFSFFIVQGDLWP